MHKKHYNRTRGASMQLTLHFPLTFCKTFIKGKQGRGKHYLSSRIGLVSKCTYEHLSPQPKTTSRAPQTQSPSPLQWYFIQWVSSPDTPYLSIYTLATPSLQFSKYTILWFAIHSTLTSFTWLILPLLN